MFASPFVSEIFAVKVNRISFISYRCYYHDLVAIYRTWNQILISSNKTSIYSYILRIGIKKKKLNRKPNKMFDLFAKKLAREVIYKYDNYAERKIKKNKNYFQMN